MQKDPQNPYFSYIVNASAGSGKTYQLSHRFLYLVASGSSPSSILTITFTKKAASEMRERIMSLAAGLVYDFEIANQFNKSMSEFYQYALKNYSNELKFRTPRSAKQTGELILSSSQLLKITTIDSIFLNWIAKFPFESGSIDNQIPINFEIMEEYEKSIVSEKAFHSTFEDFYEEMDLSFLRTPSEIRSRLDAINQMNTFYWLLQKKGENESILGELELKNYKNIENFDSISKLIKFQSPNFEIIFDTLGKDSEIRKGYLLSENLDALILDKILKKDFTIGKTKIKGKNYEKLRDIIEEINDQISNFHDKIKIERLRDHGFRLNKIYQSYLVNFNKYKLENKLLEFEDAARGCFHLFTSSESDSARFYIQKNISHLMIDEFQDTSLLQWNIFKELALEILSGYSNIDSEYYLSPSLFLVGDQKQSIYGFREAESSIISNLKPQLENLEINEIVLNKSYRSTSSMIKFVNSIFEGYLPNFPNHDTAKINEKEIIENISEITIMEPFSNKNESESIAEEEAKFVAKFIGNILSNPSRYPILNKNGTCRQVEPSDFAILYRFSTHSNTFEDQLRKIGVDTVREEEQSFYSRPEIKDFFNLIKTLTFSSDTNSFTSLLKSPLFGIDDSSVFEIYEKNYIDGKEKKDTRQNILERLELFKPLNHPIIDKLENIILNLGKYLPSEVVYRIYFQDSSLQNYLNSFGSEEGKIAISNIIDMYEHLVLLQKEQQTTFPEIYHYLLKTVKNKNSFQSKITTNAVTLQTIHKSKGLEYPFVILVDSGKNWERNDTYWLKSKRNQKIFYTDTKTEQPTNNKEFEQVKKEYQQEEKEENIRLFYVAATRASQYLLITGNHPKESSYHLKRCLDGVKNSNSFKKITIDSNEGYVENSVPIKVDFKKIRKTTIENKEDLARSTVDTEQKFAWETQILAPSKLLSKSYSNESSPKATKLTTEEEVILPQIRGQYIHKCMELYLKNQSISSEQIWESVTNKKINSTNSLAIKSLYQEWQNTVNHPHFKNLLKNKKDTFSEFSIAYLDSGKLIQGTLDLLILYDNYTGTVIDFKTSNLGTLSNNREQLKAHSLSNNYNKQLKLYQKGTEKLFSKYTFKSLIYFTKYNQAIDF